MRSSFQVLPAAISLRQLLPRASFVGACDVRTSAVTDHHTAVTPGAVFAVIDGTSRQGADYLQAALALGAGALLVDRPRPEVRVSQCVVQDVRAAYATLCSALAGNPSLRMRIAGVTGTNGKSTIAWMVRHLLRSAGRGCGLLGTIEYDDGHQTEPATLTTPDAKTLAGWLMRMQAQGVGYAAIELSSHALHQRRAYGTSLDVAVVTNITQDHYDYHGTWDAYAQAKARIFEQLRPGGLALLCHDDPGSLYLRPHAERMTNTVATYGCHPDATIPLEILEESRRGSQFRFLLAGEQVHVTLNVLGRPNILNAVAAATVALRFGVSPVEIVRGLEQFRAVPGRVERVDCGQPFDVYVDYAHTDDALGRVIEALRQITTGRVLCVFGAGGDRDKSKRPLLGAAARKADVVIVTSDNPRSEPPLQIIAEILPGLAGHSQVLVEPDRAAAIAQALQITLPEDTLLIAGKGHEQEQWIGGERFPFDDRQVVRDWLQSRRSGLLMPQEWSRAG